MKSSRIRRLGASMGIIVLLAAMITLALAAAASAQVVSDPRVAEFDPSPDHWQTLDSGAPAVVRYELGVYTIGAPAPFATADMGKPSPDYDGKIRYDFSPLLAAWQLPGGDYEARVSAVGPEGAAMSDPSNPFSFTTDATPCTYSVNTTAVTAAASGGNFDVNLFTGTGCEWAVTSAPSWVTLWTSVGSGEGTLAFAVLANSSPSIRTGSIAVAGQTVTVSQSAAELDCSYGVTPTVFSFSAASGIGEVGIKTDPGCPWSVESSQSWLVPAVAAGAGGSAFSFSVKQNNGITNRQATLTVGHWAVTVFQSGKARRTK